ncbi:ABC transporter ATP-binding protein [Candidatus Berkelbacteria bacterium]|nr:ABC transporter ATP-binding protein [Candidatus Berkelbacteria bacterium]
MAKPTAECINLVKTFALGKRAIQVIDDVSFTIEPGEFVILYGPSGSGKSTLLHLIAGLEVPSSGEIKIRGRYLSRLNQRQLANVHRTKIGMVFQQFNLIPTLSALDNVTLPQIFVGAPHEERRQRAIKLLKLLDIEKLADQLPVELSGGEQQRLAIARALVNDPWLLLIDEPTGNLDTKNAKEVIEIISDLNIHARRTILLVTHNPEYLYRAHRVLHLKDGKIIRSQQMKPYHAPLKKPPATHHFAAVREKDEN